MTRCFVIQPFDKDKFDRRYEETFKPAIEAAFVEPYRVDQDPGVMIPIDDIVKGIQDADTCFAEITTDNPNVWFELGLAIAFNKDTVLVCSKERNSPYPFDIRHRQIIDYDTGSPSDFEQLSDRITKKLTAICEKQEKMGKISQPTQIETGGLSEREVVALISIGSNIDNQMDKVGIWNIRPEMEKAGYTRIATTLALTKLEKIGLIHCEADQDIDQNSVYFYFLTDTGMKWLLDNESKVTMKTENESTSADEFEDDIPF